MEIDLAELIGTEQGQAGAGLTEVREQTICRRCGGLMVRDFCMDILSTAGEFNFAAQRCVQCGDFVDPIILRNRRLQDESMAGGGCEIVGRSSSYQNDIVVS